MEDKTNKNIICNYIDDLEHEMRTAVSSILGLAVIGEYNVCDHEKTGECFSNIRNSSKALLEYMDSAVSTIKTKLGVYSEACDRIDRNQLKNIVYECFRAKKHIREIAFSYKDEEIGDNAVKGDIFHIKYVVAHIINDAYDRFTDRMDINVKLEKLEEARFIKLIAVVKDNGKAISWGKQGEQTSDDTDSDMDRLQWKIARDVVKKTKGDIRVLRSCDGDNIIEISTVAELYEEIDDRESVTESETRFSPGGYENCRILLVDDNDLNAEITTDVIGFTGAKVDRAINGAYAISMIEKSEPFYYDMVLMDLQMPQMDGYDATIAIRMLDRKDARSIPILALTANVMLSSVQQALKAGMDNYIIKPIELSSLIKLLDKYCKMKLTK